MSEHNENHNENENGKHDCGNPNCLTGVLADLRADMEAKPIRVHKDEHGTFIHIDDIERTLVELVQIQTVAAVPMNGPLIGQIVVDAQGALAHSALTTLNRTEAQVETTVTVPDSVPEGWS